MSPGLPLSVDRYCHECGYNLRGLVEPVCSECGRPFDPADIRSYRETPRPTPWWQNDRSQRVGFVVAGLAVFLMPATCMQFEWSSACCVTILIYPLVMGTASYLLLRGVLAEWMDGVMTNIFLGIVIGVAGFVFQMTLIVTFEGWWTEWIDTSAVLLSGGAGGVAGLFRLREVI